MRLAGNLVLVGVVSLLVLALPATALSETWTDEFDDVTLTSAREGVVLEGGTVRLAPPVPERQGLQLGASSELLSPSIVNFGSQYYMYYTQSGSIALATSADADSWTPWGVVIPPGFAGPTDSSGAAYEDVLVVGSTFHMWYSGLDSTGTYAIHHATSSEGTVWSSGGLVVSASSEGVSGHIYFPAVVQEGGTFMMWFTHQTSVNSWIRKATSADGDSWVSEGIVLSPVNDGIDDAGPRMPDVVHDGSDYVMWYACVAVWEGQICRSRSTDGIHWTREGVVVAPDPNLVGENVGLAAPEAMLLAPGSYRVWYQGRGSSYPNQIYSALVTGRYRTEGSVISVPIELPRNLTWLSASVSRTTPGGTSVKLTVVDATTGFAISGHTNVTEMTLSLLGIDSRTFPRISLQAWLSGAGPDTPSLESWSVTFGTPPVGPSSLWQQYPGLIVVAIIGAGAATLAVLAYVMKGLAAEPPRG